MFSKYKSIFILSAVSILLGLILFFIESNKTELKISNIKPSSNFKEYSIGPAISRFHIAYVDTNVPIKTKLTDTQYGLISFFEDVKAIALPAQNLSISFKRLAELKLWNEKLSIVKNVSNSEELKSWWKPYQSSPLVIINNGKFGSWESILARYLISTEKYFDHVNSQESSMRNALLTALRLSLNENQLSVNHIINENQNNKDKEYLQILSDSVFDQLNSQIDKLLPHYNPIVHEYDLSLIKKDKEYGIYNISLSKPNDNFEWGNALLQGQAAELPPPISDSESEKNNNILFANIEITPNQDKLIFALTDIKNSARGNWISEINQTNQQYKYVLSLKDINPAIGYMLDLTYQTKYPVDFTIEELQGSLTDSNQITWDKNNMIWEDVLLSPNRPGHYLRKVSFALNNKLNMQRVILESKKPLSQDFFNHFKLQIFPIFESYITLKKIARLDNPNIEIDTKKIRENVYLVNIINISVEEERRFKKELGLTYLVTNEKHHQYSSAFTVVFWPPILIRTVLFILFLVIVYEIFLRRLLERNKQLYSPYLRKIKYYLSILYNFTISLGNSAYSKLRNIRLILFAIVLAGIFLDILLIKLSITKPNSLNIIYFVIAFWLATLLGYRGSTILSYYNSLILLILFSIALMLNLPIISERILTWSYAFLLIGSVHSLLEVSIKRNYTYDTVEQNLLVVPKLLLLLTIIQKGFQYYLLALKYFGFLLDKILIIIQKGFQYYLLALKYFGFLLDKILTIILKSFDRVINSQLYSYYKRSKLELLRVINSQLYSYYKRSKLELLRVINSQMHSFYQHTKISLPKFIQYSAKSTLFLTVIVVIYLFVLVINVALKSVQVQITKESRNPVIRKFEPRIVYKSIKVIIRGKNFGWQQEGEELMSNFGKVSTDFWSDQKIIFTVPLHWQTGELILRIEKPTIWEGEPMLAKSKRILLRILPITASFTENDEEFYEQIELSDEETRKINGY